MSSDKRHSMPATQKRTRAGTSRRRFLAITGLAGISGIASSVWCRNFLPPRAQWQWKGVLFGADVSIDLHGIENAALARDLTQRCFIEMRRLEQIFSLFVPESCICRLNRDGHVSNCPLEFVALVTEACRYHSLTHGAFDITVQPLWKAMDEHNFLDGPLDAAQRDAALAKVGGDRVRIQADRVSFTDPDMAITLNGIAQGFITDVIAELLLRNGVDQALVNMGEYRAIGSHPQGRPWHLGIRNPGDLSDAEVMDSVPLESGSLAVSGGYGYVFDPSQRYHHLLNPHTGENLPADRSIVVTAPNATMADALSTACAVIDDDAAHALCRELACGLRIYRSGA
ncbi:MAG: FAD:protein FMN transferase [Verrucomicrobia bacterium]|nr:FAD:protein FMN transferase [Verrucomicrobiota bacterium]